LESLKEDTNLPTVYSELAGVMRDDQHLPATQEVIASRILELYDKALQRRIRAQREAFRRIRTFENSLNRFLQGKSLHLSFELRAGEPRRPRARVRLEETGVKRTSLCCRLVSDKS
jgi:hypothetical protein